MYIHMNKWGKKSLCRKLPCYIIYSPVPSLVSVPGKGIGFAFSRWDFVGINAMQRRCVTNVWWLDQDQEDS